MHDEKSNVASWIRGSPVLEVPKMDPGFGGVRWLAEPYADASLRRAIIAEVEILDERPVSALMGLLAQVKPHATFPVTLRGLQ